MNKKGVMIAGAFSGVGKTTITLSLLAALTKRNIKVSPFKVGPDYIDTAFASFVCKNQSRNLDGYMLSENAICHIFDKGSKNSEISVVEGVMGLYDGFSIQKDCGSSAHISKILKLPVILVINAGGIMSSAAAMVLGYKLYDNAVNIKGVIINKVGSDNHYNKLKAVIERDCNIECLGYFPKDMDIELKSRHLGLVPSFETDELFEKIEKMATLAENYLNIDRIIEISSECKFENMNFEYPKGKFNVKIGVALDNAFNFYYKDNLDLLEYLGAKLVFFSPINDEKLPNDIDGIYFGGGFPEVFAQQLSENTKMLENIKNLSNSGIPIIAECGGLMYLNKSIIDLQGKEHKMVGIFDGKSTMTQRLHHFGYVEVEIAKNCILGNENEKFKAHEFHRSVTEIENANCAFNVSKENKNWQDGYMKNNTLAFYQHIHFYSNINLAINFLRKCS